MKHELIKLSDVPAEGSRIVPFFGRELHVYRANGGIRAVANTCMHLGGPLACKNGEFVCPWHGARFDMTTGARQEGPAPEGSQLMSVPVRAEGDALFYVWGE